MNTYLLGLVSKWISIISISVAGVLNVSLFKEQTYETENINQTKNITAGLTEIKYETEKIYNNKLPSDVTITKQKGQNGLAYTDTNNNIIETLENPVTEILEIGTGEKSQYVGKLTGYGADCRGCSGSGNLSCKTKSGKTWSLTRDGQTYNDDDFGKVRILAAALEKFPCGTIIKVENTKLGTFNAIVLDTGGSMKKAWSRGNVHMDLAFISEKSSDVHKATGSKIKYTVQRWGW